VGVFTHLLLTKKKPNFSILNHMILFHTFYKNTHQILPSFLYKNNFVVLSKNNHTYLLWWNIAQSREHFFYKIDTTFALFIYVVCIKGWGVFGCQICPKLVFPQVYVFYALLLTLTLFFKNHEIFLLSISHKNLIFCQKKVNIFALSEHVCYFIILRTNLKKKEQKIYKRPY
jgi:hypothetical protein